MKSQLPPRSLPSDQVAQSSSANGKQVYRILLTVMIVLLLITVSITLWLAYEVFKPQVIALIQVPTPSLSPTATPPCVHSTLSLGPYTYPMDVVETQDTGIIPTLAKPAGTAWLLSETSNPYVIVFVPALGSLDMQAALSMGDELVVQWADCTRAAFVLNDFQPGIPDATSLLGQNSPGIAVIVQSVGGKAEYVIYGQNP